MDIKTVRIPFVDLNLQHQSIQIQLEQAIQTAPIDSNSTRASNSGSIDTRRFYFRESPFRF